MTGLDSASLSTVCRLAVIVAENSRVCLDGGNASAMHLSSLHMVGNFVCVYTAGGKATRKREATRC